MTLRRLVVISVLGDEPIGTINEPATIQPRHKAGERRSRELAHEGRDPSWD